MHKSGVKICGCQKDLTIIQKYFLGLMAAEEIRERKTFLAKFDVLCQANGVKFSESDNDPNSFRGMMLEKQRRKREDSMNGR